MSTVIDLPVTHYYPTGKPGDQRTIAVEQLPELAHRGCGFRAYFKGSPNGIDGPGTDDESAIAALWEAVEDWDEILRERELGEFPYWRMP